MANQLKMNEKAAVRAGAVEQQADTSRALHARVEQLAATDTKLVALFALGPGAKELAQVVVAVVVEEEEEEERSLMNDLNRR